MRTVLLLSAIVVVAHGAPAESSEKLTGIACRSVHLQYPAPESTLYYNELAIEQSAPGTFFMACGFNGGYLGIQQLANDRKVVLFSIWEPGGQNDPNATPTERRVQVISQGQDVTVKRFGGEGTGGQSFYEYDWKLGEKYCFVVDARLKGNRTVYTGYFFIPEEDRWQQMASFSTLAEGRLLRGYNSFVEDFRRNRESTKHARRAQFGNGWVRTAKDVWHPLAIARFTADGNRATNIDAGASEADSFYLATGGETKNIGMKLREKLNLEATDRQSPTNLPASKKPE